MILQRLSRPFRRFAVDKAAVAAVEFAMILPLMLLLYLGGNEFGHALTLKRKVTHVSSTIADLVAQSKTISNADMSNILDAAAAVMTPYSEAPLSMKVSLIYINNSSIATVIWSDSRNTVSLGIGSEVTVPADVKKPNTYVIAAEAHYPYTPTFGYVLSGSFDLSDTFFLRPRQGEKVTRSS